jgi:hypothetical protein
MHNGEFRDLLFGWSEEGASRGSEMCPDGKNRKACRYSVGKPEKRGSIRRLKTLMRE